MSGGVASLENLKRGSRVNPESQKELGGQRPNVFDQIARASLRVEHGMVVDFNAFQLFLSLFALAY